MVLHTNRKGLLLVKQFAFFCHPTTTTTTIRPIGQLVISVDCRQLPTRPMISFAGPADCRKLTVS